MIDSTVLVDATRRLPDALTILAGQRNAGSVLVSIISAMEFVQGCRDRLELRDVQRFLATIAVLPVDEAISVRGLALLEQFALSHRLRLADALIAATALEESLPLYTANVRDFRMIPDLDVRRPY